MRKVFLAGMLLLLSASVFCQEPLTKDQEKRVKAVQSETTKRLNAIVANEKMSPGEKKANMQLLRNERDAKLADFMTSAQVSQILAKDSVKWDAAIKKIDKNEATRLKNERQDKLNEISLQQKELDKRQAELDKQMKELKIKQEDIKKQRKVLKDKEKATKSQYK